jgi:hypothetical protein
LDFFEKQPDELNDQYEEERANEYDHVNEKYGIDLSSVDAEEVFPGEVINAFHSLNEKCKFLLVFKYMLNLSHKDIVDCLCNFYELKNENVSKTELKRCLDRLKKNSAGINN